MKKIPEKMCFVGFGWLRAVVDSGKANLAELSKELLLEAAPPHTVPLHGPIPPNQSLELVEPSSSS